MSDLQHLDGYGASIEYDGNVVRLIGGKVQTKVWRTPHIEFPVSDIVEIDHSSANMMVNGKMLFQTLQHPDSYVPRESFEFIPENSLIVHWRRKDRAAFERLYATLQERINPDVETRRELAKKAHADYLVRRDAALRERAGVAASASRSGRLPVPVATIPGLKREEVVGESQYQGAIAQAVSHQGRKMMARIDWDVDNAYDAGAVMVLLQDGDADVLCGYLAREVAPKWLPEIQRLRGDGNFIHVPAQVFGGEPDRPNFGVWIGQSFA